MNFWSWHSFTPTWEGDNFSEADIHLHLPEMAGDNISEADIHLHIPEMAGDNFLRLTFIYTYLRWQVTTFWGWHSLTHTWDSERTVDNYVTLTLIHTFLRLCKDSWQLFDPHLFTPTWDCVKTVDNYVTLTYSHLPETVWRQSTTMWPSLIHTYLRLCEDSW